MNASFLSLRRATQVGLFLVLAQLGVGTTGTVTLANPKTYLLFMGADISLEQGKGVHPVEDVTSTSLVIKPDGKPVKVSLDAEVNLRISESLKISRTSLVVEGLKADRAFSPGNDPFEKLSRAVSFAAGESAVADIANHNAIVQSSLSVAAGNAFATADTPESLAEATASAQRAQAAQAGADAALLQAHSAPTSAAFDVGAQVSKMGTEDGNFDAIRASFEVTSEKDLSQPYYALIAKIREPDSKPGMVRKWAYVKSLGSISAGVTRKVNVYRSGLPPGYILESYEVHLYNGNEELATNLSRKRVPLTAEEAMEFRIIEYVSANKGRTLPATPVTTVLSSEVSAPLSPAQLSGTCYVRVDKAGRVAAVFRDAAGKQRLQDPALESALKTLQFKPALQAGKPIEALVPLHLNQVASR